MNGNVRKMIMHSSASETCVTQLPNSRLYKRQLTKIKTILSKLTLLQVKRIVSEMRETHLHFIKNKK